MHIQMHIHIVGFLAGIDVNTKLHTPLPGILFDDSEMNVPMQVLWHDLLPH